MNMNQTVRFSTFDYLKPTEKQLKIMEYVRGLFKSLVYGLSAELPDGTDKATAIRKIREAAMWSKVAATRHGNGAPRLDEEA